MCVKFPPGDLNPSSGHHTTPAFILMEWPPYQGCTVVLLIVKDTKSFTTKNLYINVEGDWCYFDTIINECLNCFYNWRHIILLNVHNNKICNATNIVEKTLRISRILAR